MTVRSARRTSPSRPLAACCSSSAASRRQGRAVESRSPAARPRPPVIETSRGWQVYARACPRGDLVLRYSRIQFTSVCAFRRPWRIDLRRKRAWLPLHQGRCSLLFSPPNTLAPRRRNRCRSDGGAAVSLDARLVAADPFFVIATQKPARYRRVPDRNRSSTASYCYRLCILMPLPSVSSVVGIGRARIADLPPARRGDARRGQRDAGAVLSLPACSTTSRRCCAAGAAGADRADAAVACAG